MTVSASTTSASTETTGVSFVADIEADNHPDPSVQVIGYILVSLLVYNGESLMIATTSDYDSFATATL